LPTLYKFRAALLPRRLSIQLRSLRDKWGGKRQEKIVETLQAEPQTALNEELTKLSKPGGEELAAPLQEAHLRFRPSASIFRRSGLQILDYRLPTGYAADTCPPTAWRIPVCETASERSVTAETVNSRHYDWIALLDSTLAVVVI